MIRDENNREIWDVGFFYNRSKSKAYRQQVLDTHTALFTFFKDNSLLNVNPFDDEGIIKTDQIFFENDFTETGLLMISMYHSPKPPVMKWLTYIEKGGKLENKKILIDCLCKLQSK